MKKVFRFPTVSKRRKVIHYIPKRTWGSWTIFYEINSRFLKHNILKNEMGKVGDYLNSWIVNNSIHIAFMLTSEIGQKPE